MLKKEVTILVSFFVATATPSPSPLIRETFNLRVHGPRGLDSLAIMVEIVAIGRHGPGAAA